MVGSLAGIITRILSGPQVFKNYIDGEWIPSSAKETFPNENPAYPKQIVGHFQKSTAEDAKAAIDAAERAFERWSAAPAPLRGRLLLKVARLLEENKEELARTITLEMGKILKEARGDVQEAIDNFEYFAGEGRRLFGHTTPSELQDKFAMTVRMPIGVCGLITPWNFPIAIPSMKMAAALICGNAVVFKPSSDTPLCATRLVEVLDAAGIPKGVVNLVTGPADTVGHEIVKNQKVRCVSFTGHRDTGDWILKNAGLKRVGLEMGGKNAIIVLEDADLSLVAEGVAWGAFATTGQRCSAASRVIVPESLQAQLERELVERAKRIVVGSGLDPRVMMGPLVNAAALEKTARYVDIGNKEGAKMICGGHVGGHTAGYFYEPTIFTNVSTSMKIAQDEIFGPVTSIIPVKNLDEAIAAANSIEYGLVASIFTSNIRNAMRSIKKLQCGVQYINAPTVGAEVHLPWGGVKHSGTGWREGGIEGVNEFTETKVVYIDYSGRLQRAQIDISKLG